jgi:hypothetical protein
MASIKRRERPARAPRRPSIESAETRALDPATRHDELLAQEQVLRDQSRTRRRYGQDEI